MQSAKTSRREEMKLNVFTEMEVTPPKVAVGACMLKILPVFLYLVTDHTPTCNYICITIQCVYHYILSHELHHNGCTVQYD